MKKKIVLLVILIILLVAGGLVYAYYATDLFKTDKELFFAYMIEEKRGPDLKIEELLAYNEKQKNTIYESEGEIVFNTSGVDEASTLNEFNIAFEGKTDNANKVFEQEISFDYSQGYIIPIKLKRDVDTFGMQSDILGESRYIAIRNENLKELAERFGLDSQYIPDKIESITFTPEELTELGNTYYQFFDERLTDDMFSKEKQDNQTIVKLSMSAEKFTEILLELMRTINDDEMIKSKLPEVYIEALKDATQSLEESLQSEPIDDNASFEVKIYTEKGKVKKIDIVFLQDNDTYMNIVEEFSDTDFTVKCYNENILLFEEAFSVETKENDVIYNLSYLMYQGTEENEEPEVEINAELAYNNLLKLDAVQEEFNIEIKQKNSMNDLTYDDFYTNSPEEHTINIQYKNEKIFTQAQHFESLNEDNAVIINDATDEELQNVLYTIYESLGLV